MGSRPILNSTLFNRGRINGGEFTIHPIRFVISCLRNWISYAFSKMHPVTDDGDPDAVIVTIDGEEGENESNRMYS